ncbi:hypothetical protein TorRG33x02_356740 [Trema orientale]|uniref:Uncharacterized protein n=1 Tax=Trema orientale TaxID=63057 RepID=A0A2P5A6N5_TREOI|nr:hypothetical protein TorRG33x02_356740 [Trema orientale]
MGFGDGGLGPVLWGLDERSSVNLCDCSHHNDWTAKS